MNKIFNEIKEEEEKTDWERERDREWKKGKRDNERENRKSKLMSSENAKFVDGNFIKVNATIFCKSLLFRHFVQSTE